MFIEKNEENEENEESKENDTIIISKNNNEINYLLKIYFSKDKHTIIFKVEEESIQTYYYYEKFCLIDFKKNNKRFNNLENLTEIFENFKFIKNKYSTKIENDSTNKIKITFINSSEIIAIFFLRKKILSQNRLNPILIEEIHENKSKLKSIKKQSTKLEKTVNNQKDMIDKINTEIKNINDNLENVYKEINSLKEQLNQEKKEISDNKNNKEKKSKEKNKDIKDKDDKKKFCKKNTLYELLFFLNLIIIILISYLFMRLKNLEEREESEKLNKNKIKKRYSFLNILESMTEDDLKFIQETFETGEIFSFGEEENEVKYEENENENENEIIINKNKDKINKNKMTKTKKGK